jgi:oligoribonuclease
MGTQHHKGKTDMLWIDVETFGLTRSTGPLIELGLMLTDADLNVKATFQNTVWTEEHQDAYGALLTQDWAYKQHRKSGLWTDAMATGLPSLNVLDLRAVEWMKDNDALGLPMCGSTVGFDRNFARSDLPGMESICHYRSIDISSIKELCRRWNPRVYAMRDQFSADRNLHRVLPDLEDSLMEAQYYRDEFLFTVGPEPSSSFGPIGLDDMPGETDDEKLKNALARQKQGRSQA